MKSIALVLLLLATARACAVDGDCVAGESVCFDGQCRDLVKEAGLGCTGDTLPNSTYGVRPCDSSPDSALRCANGFCDFLIAPGSRCVDDSDCGSNMDCISTFCRYPFGEGPCLTTSHCLSGLTCDLSTATCLVFINQPCALSSECADGLLCSGGVCKRPAFNETCDAGTRCDSGLACSLDGLCLKQPNFLCTADEECVSGICDPNNSDRCSAIPTGDPCATDASCAEQACVAGLCAVANGRRCFGDASICADPAAQCVSSGCRVPVLTGEQCDLRLTIPSSTASSSPIFCSEGYCDPFTLRCKPYLAFGDRCHDFAIGSNDCANASSSCAISGDSTSVTRCVNSGAQSCQSSSECATGRICDSTSTCALTIGYSCASSPCAAGLECVDNRCYLGSVGTPCVAADTCASGTCSEGTCKNPDGEPCATDSVCASGTCTDDFICGTAPASEPAVPTSEPSGTTAQVLSAVTALGGAAAIVGVLVCLSPQ